MSFIRFLIHLVQVRKRGKIVLAERQARAATLKTIRRALMQRIEDERDLFDGVAAPDGRTASARIFSNHKSRMQGMRMALDTINSINWKD